MLVVVVRQLPRSGLVQHYIRLPKVNRKMRLDEPCILPGIRAASDGSNRGKRPPDRNCLPVDSGIYCCRNPHIPPNQSLSAGL
jgi:hypothetical protein